MRVSIGYLFDGPVHFWTRPDWSRRTIQILGRILKLRYSKSCKEDLDTLGRRADSGQVQELGMSSHENRKTTG